MCQDCKEPYCITTAIAYASGKSHIGNIYRIILADNTAKYKREQGYDVFFQTGTDEHGQKTEEKAEAADVILQESVDKVAAEIKRIWDLMNTSYDKLIHTTNQDHEVQMQKISKKLYDQGDIYKGYYERLYCTLCESFFTESQLVNGKCPNCGREVKPAKEEAYFFRMSKYTSRLIGYINEHLEFIQPISRKNEMVNNFLLSELQDLCVSKTTLSWGIPVDFSPKHVTYVWLDTLTNYITGTGYDCDGSGTDQFKKYWPTDLHLIGKDIIRLYTIYWPIFLMAPDVPPPKQVSGRPWLLQGDGKMSKSKGNVLYTDTLVDFFGVDAVRYSVLHETPFDNDGIISWELMVERTSSDLVNVLGSLVNHTIPMSNKYFDGVVCDKGVCGEVDKDLKKVVLEEVKKADARMEQLHVVDTMTEIFNILRRCNEHIDETTSWTSARDEGQKDGPVIMLYNLTEAIAIGASPLYSLMPETAEKILTQIHAGKHELFQMDAFRLYPNGQKVTDKPETLFVHVDIKEVLEKVEAMHGVEAADRKQAGGQDGSSDNAEDNSIDLEVKPEITYDDFAKFQLQMGETIKCEVVPKPKKLLCSQVKIGNQICQILSDIKAYYSPEEMVSKKAMVVTNLKSAKLAGMVSEGTILRAEDAEDSLAFMTPEKSMSAGAEIY